MCEIPPRQQRARTTDVEAGIVGPDAAVHLAMLDVQGEEEHIFHSRDVQVLLQEHRIERLLVGIHGNVAQQKRRVSGVVVNALKAAGYTIVFEQLLFSDQPDGLVVAVAPNVRIEAAPGSGTLGG